MANEAYRPNTAQDLIKMYNLDSLIADRKQTKASAEKIKVLEETSNSLKDFAEEVEKQIEDLEKIADGKITTYYYSGVPTLTNFPANEWTVDEYENHIGDMYYDKETGLAYKFLFDNELNEYLWRKETNPELVEALAKANNALEIAEGAQTTANSKMQVFVDTPYPPYKVGDLWLKDDKTIYRCRAEKTSGSYDENDWKVATDFTNDDYAKNVENELNQFKINVEADYATKVQLETTKDEINLSVEGLTTKTETLEDELKGKADVINVTELTQRVDLVQSATELNVTAIEKLETNDVEQAEKIAEFEVTVDGVSTTIENQNNQISKVVQTVEELNSKIGDLADITTSQESNNGKLEFENINQSEPIRIVIRPLNESISYLYPSSGLYPSDTLYPKTRTLRFHNKTTGEDFDLVLPDDILYYDSENYDEFILDYDGLSCVINKKVGWNADGTTYVLDNPTTKEYEYTHLEITDGDYEITILGYDNVYVFVRLMAQNIYTTQFATKAELNSEISQTSQAINLSVDKKLENYSTTTEMNAKIEMTANSIEQSVSQKVGEDEIISSINNAIKNGQGVIELKSNSVVIDSDNFKLNTEGGVTATEMDILGGTIDLTTSLGNVTVGKGTTGLISMKATSDGIDYEGVYNVAGMTYGKDGNYRYRVGASSDSPFVYLYNGSNTRVARFCVSNNYGYISLCNASGTEKVSLSGSGHVQCVGLTQTSKAEEKKNFELYTDALKEIEKTDIYKYNFKDEEDGTKKHLGFVIGKNYNYSKQITAVDENGKEIGVDNYSMTSLCLQAIKELLKKVETLENKIKELESDINEKNRF